MTTTLFPAVLRVGEDNKSEKVTITRTFSPGWGLLGDGSPEFHRAMQFERERQMKLQALEDYLQSKVGHLFE